MIYKPVSLAFLGMIPRAFGPVSAGSIAQAIEVTVTSLANPATELALLGTVVPTWAVCHQNGAATDDATWYRLDATSDATNVPYLVASATAGLKWTAIAGRYVNQAETINGALAGLSSLSVTSNTALSGTATVTGLLTASSALTVASTATLSGLATVVDGNFSILGSADATKKIKFEADTQSSGFTFTWDIGAQTGSRTLSVPALVGNDTIATLGTAQTISGAKTLSAVATFSNATASTSTSTGALVVSTGGIGCGGAIIGDSFGTTGSFTPTLVGTGGTAAHTYTAQVGVYRKMGKTVQFSIRVTISAKDAGMTGTVSIAGLPFAAYNVGVSQTPNIGYCLCTLTAGYYRLIGNIGPAATSITMYEIGSNAVNAVPVANIPATFDIIMTGVYESP